MYSINDRIRIVDYNKLPENKRIKAYGRVCNKIATIVDIIHSKADNENYYQVRFDENKMPSKILFTEDMITKEERFRYTFDIIVKEGIVIVRMHDGNDMIVADGHGHIFNGNGPDRIAQAASYACRRLYESLKPKETF